MPFDAPFHFGEEPSGNPGFRPSRGMEGDGDAVGDTLLEFCQIGDDRVKGLFPEMLPQLLQIALLVASTFLESRDEITQKLKPRIEMLPDVLDCLRYLDDPLSAPVGCFHGEITKSLAQRRQADQGKPWRAVEYDEPEPWRKVFAASTRARWMSVFSHTF